MKWNLDKLTTDLNKFLAGDLVVADFVPGGWSPHRFVLGNEHMQRWSPNLTKPCAGYFDVDGKMVKVQKHGTKCTLMFDEHRELIIVLLKLTRNLTNLEACTRFYAIKQYMVDNDIDGLCVINDPKEFTIAAPTEEDIAMQAKEDALINQQTIDNGSNNNLPGEGTESGLDKG